MRKLFLNSILGLLFFSCVFGQGFLKRNGQTIVNGNGDEILLRGMGLGGWMLQEGYMLQTSAFANAQYEIRTKIEELIGEEGTNTFYEAWLANHCRKVDIDSLKAWGFNSIRLPMHYNLFTLPIEDEPVSGENTWLSKGFEMTDQLLEWCEANNLFLILDLHAAPGGQGYESSISDYNPLKPSLWESSENRAKTVALWRKLAERYAAESWIGGYDLINETNWDLPSNAMLKELYIDITQAIREVDTNHLLFIEGNWFANDFTGLVPPWDDNMAYSFHKYWSYNDQNSIQWVLDIRNNYNVPIWCGEAGENSNYWFTSAIKLLERNNIGWAWWPLKKVESISGPLSVKKSAGYQTLLDYWSGNGSKPSVQFATNALMGLAENLKLENCQFQKDVIDAMFRQVQTNETKPYKEHRLPGTLPAAEFDLGTYGYTYYDSDIADYHVSSGTYTTWNNGWTFRNDGVDIEKSNDAQGSPYSIGWISNNEWLGYSVYIEEASSYDIIFRIASMNGGGKIKLLLNKQAVTGNIEVPKTNGWYNWQDLEINDLKLESGLQFIQLVFVQSGFNLNQIKFIADTNGIENDDKQPLHFSLSQNYPNPFNNFTIIPFKLEKPARAKISIFDVKGRIIRQLVDDRFGTEAQEIIWDGTDQMSNLIVSGIYFYRLQVGTKSETKSMVFLK